MRPDSHKLRKASCKELYPVSFFISRNQLKTLKSSLCRNLNSLALNAVSASSVIPLTLARRSTVPAASNPLLFPSHPASACLRCCRQPRPPAPGLGQPPLLDSVHPPRSLQK